jgi:hypothetical protein
MPYSMKEGAAELTKEGSGSICMRQSCIASRTSNGAICLLAFKAVRNGSRLTYGTNANMFEVSKHAELRPYATDVVEAETRWSQALRNQTKPLTM